MPAILPIIRGEPLADAVTEARDASLVEIAAKLQRFSQEPTPTNAKWVAKDIQSFLAASRATKQHGSCPVQMGYFVGLQLAARAHLQKFAPDGHLPNHYAALREELHAFGDQMEIGPRTQTLARLATIAALAQHAAESCGLAPLFSDHPKY